jgi:hypothetical protein
MDDRLFPNGCHAGFCRFALSFHRHVLNRGIYGQMQVRVSGHHFVLLSCVRAQIWARFIFLDIVFGVSSEPVAGIRSCVSVLGSELVCDAQSDFFLSTASERGAGA